MWCLLSWKFGLLIWTGLNNSPVQMYRTIIYVFYTCKYCHILRNINWSDCLETHGNFLLLLMATPRPSATIICFLDICGKYFKTICHICSNCKVIFWATLFFLPGFQAEICTFLWSLHKKFLHFVGLSAHSRRLISFQRFPILCILGSSLKYHWFQFS